MILVTILPTPALNQHGIMLAADMLQTIKHALGPGGTAGLHIALFWSEISPYPKSNNITYILIYIIGRFFKALYMLQGCRHANGLQHFMIKEHAT